MRNKYGVTYLVGWNYKSIYYGKDRPNYGPNISRDKDGTEIVFLLPLPLLRHGSFLTPWKEIWRGYRLFCVSLYMRVRTKNANDKSWPIWNRIVFHLDWGWRVISATRLFCRSDVDDTFHLRHDWSKDTAFVKSLLNGKMQIRTLRTQ